MPHDKLDVIRLRFEREADRARRALKRLLDQAALLENQAASLRCLLEEYRQPAEAKAPVSVDRLGARVSLVQQLEVALGTVELQRQQLEPTLADARGATLLWESKLLGLQARMDQRRRDAQSASRRRENRQFSARLKVPRATD